MTIWQKHNMLLKEGGISTDSADFNKTLLYKALMKKPTMFELEMPLTPESWPAPVPTAPFVPAVRSVFRQARATLTQCPVSGNG